MNSSVRTILVADDNHDFAETLSELLSDDGFEVRVAHDGLEAVEAYRRHPADVLLFDFAMPRCDGLRAFLEIRALSPAVPVIFLTAYQSEAFRIRMEKDLEPGRLCVLMKPVDYPLLSSRLSRLEIR